MSKAAYLKTNGKLMRCYIILETCYKGSVLVISAFCALVESGLDIKMIICIHQSRQTSSERGTLVGIEDKMPSTLSSKYLDYFFREHYNSKKRIGRIAVSIFLDILLELNNTEYQKRKSK